MIISGGSRRGRRPERRGDHALRSLGNVRREDRLEARRMPGSRRITIAAHGAVGNFRVSSAAWSALPALRRSPYPPLPFRVAISVAIATRRLASQTRCALTPSWKASKANASPIERSLGQRHGSEKRESCFAKNARLANRRAFLFSQAYLWFPSRPFYGPAGSIAP